MVLGGAVSAGAATPETASTYVSHDDGRHGDHDHWRGDDRPGGWYHHGRHHQYRWDGRHHRYDRHHRHDRWDRWDGHRHHQHDYR
jgi:hypothetical protein